MKYIKCIVIAIILNSLLILQAFAAEPYCNYTYDSNKMPQAEPQAYLPEKTINGSTLGTTEFNSPMDVFVAKDERVYIADSGNNRIIVLKKDLTLEKIIINFDNNGKIDTFNNPNGIYVTNLNEIFIADTDNLRVVSITPEGKAHFILGRPDTERIQGDFKYQPVKVAVDKAGRIFVVSLNLSEGIIEYDENGNFMSFFGSVKTKSDTSQIFWRFLADYFPSLKSQIIKNVPTEYSSIAVDSKGFIMGTVSVTSNSSDRNFIKRLNPMGIDVLRRYDIIPPNGDMPEYKYKQLKGDFEESYSQICDIAVRENGIYSVLDSNYGRVHTYTYNGELMYVFGAIGTKFGQVGLPAALDVINGDHYLVVDSKYNQIIMYKPTDYGQIISKAVGDYFQRNYEKSGQEWKIAINHTSKSRLVYDGYSKSLYKINDYLNSMKFYKHAKDATGYSDAYEGYRTVTVEKYFSTIFITVVILIAAFMLYRSKLKKIKKRRNKYYEAS